MIRWKRISALALVLGLAPVSVADVAPAAWAAAGDPDDEDEPDDDELDDESDEDESEDDSSDDAVDDDDEPDEDEPGEGEDLDDDEEDFSDSEEAGGDEAELDDEADEADGSDVDEGADEVEDAADEDDDDLDDSADDVEDAADEEVDEAEDAAEDSGAEGDDADDGENLADEAADDAEDVADDAADEADDAADEAAKLAEDAADDAARADRDAVDEAEDRAEALLKESDVGSDHPGSGQSGSDREAQERTETRAVEASAQSDAREEELAFELDDEGYEVTTGEVLVLSDEPLDEAAVNEAGLEVASREVLPGLGLEFVSVRAPAGHNAGVAIARLRGRTEALLARNHLFTAGRIGKSPNRATPSLRPRDARGTVGVIDGGVAPAALAGAALLESASFSQKPSAAAVHGSAVAAVLANAGVRKIYSANIFAGRKATAWGLVKALDWMATNKVPVINISLAGAPNPIVHKAIGILVSRGHVVVAAVGNNGPAAPPLYPAAYPEVVAVTAVDQGGAVYKRANRGPHTMFSAPGVNVTVNDGSGKPRVVSGTSFAAPVVSARLARLLDHPDPQMRKRAVAAIAKSARDLGRPGRDPVYGLGLVKLGN
jgi:hypothetical protein